MALLKKTSIKQGLEVENSIRANGNDVSLVGHTNSIDAFPDVWMPKLIKSLKILQ